MRVKALSGSSGGGGVTCDKLWENPSPTSSFSAQTVTLDLSSYDGIFIDGMWGDGDPVTTTSYHQWFYFPKERWSYTGNAISCYSGNRSVSISTSGVAFGNYSGGAGLNGRNIPISIYGVKGLTIDA